jgi:hypothetical protein
MTLEPRMTPAFTSVAVAGTNPTVLCDEVAAVDPMGVAVTRSIDGAGGLTSMGRFAQVVRRALADEPLLRMAVWRRRGGRV